MKTISITDDAWVKLNVTGAIIEDLIDSEWQRMVDKTGAPVDGSKEIGDAKTHSCICERMAKMACKKKDESTYE